MDGDDGPQARPAVVAEHDLLVVVGPDAVEDVHFAQATRDYRYWTTNVAIWCVSCSWQKILKVPGWVALILTSPPPGGISVRMP